MKRLILVVVIALGAIVPTAANANTMPVLTGVFGRLQTRPFTVDLSADGSGLVAGVTGQHPTQNTPGNPFGRLHWTTWNSTEGRAWGAEWIDNCEPSCAQAVYRAYNATVHVYDPSRAGVFLRMTIKSRFGGTYSAQYGEGGWGWNKSY